MRISKWIWGLILISIIGTIIVYPKLPDIIPIHWNTSGEADNYKDKIFAFFTAGLPLILTILLIYLPKIDPKRDSYQKHRKAYEVFLNVLLLFFVLIHWVALLAALGYSFNMGIVVGTAVGILFIIIGNYMRQIRHNYFFGIKTPWTLASEKVWVKTHRVGSWVFIAFGVILITSGFIGNEIAVKVLIGIGALGILGLYVYSYFVFKNLKE